MDLHIDRKYPYPAGYLPSLLISSNFLQFCQSLHSLAHKLQHFAFLTSLHSLTEGWRQAKSGSNLAKPKPDPISEIKGPSLKKLGPLNFVSSLTRLDLSQGRAQNFFIGLVINTMPKHIRFFRLKLPSLKLPSINIIL